VLHRVIGSGLVSVSKEFQRGVDPSHCNRKQAESILETRGPDQFRGMAGLLDMHRVTFIRFCGTSLCQPLPIFAYNTLIRFASPSADQFLIGTFSMSAPTHWFTFMGPKLVWQRTHSFLKLLSGIDRR